MFDYDKTNVTVFTLPQRESIDAVLDDSNDGIVAVTNSYTYVVEGMSPEQYEEYLVSNDVDCIENCSEDDDTCYEWVGCNQFHIYTHSEHEQDWLKGK